MESYRWLPGWRRFPEGTVSTFAYDSLGHQTQSVVGDDVTQDCYDGDSNLTLSIDPDGNTTDDS